MKTAQHRWSTEEGWTRLAGAAHPGLAPQLVLLFASCRLLADDDALDALQRIHPAVRILGCSTAGEIAGTSVLDDGGIATAIEFERTTVRISVCKLEGAGSSRATGVRCARELHGPGLKHVLVFSEGLRVNGSELVRGLTGALPEGVAVTGGLAGDDDRFSRTLLYIDGHSATDMVIGIGLYGADLQVGIGSLGGWDPFGPYRLITRSDANVLYELDGEPALQLYRRYLGPHAAGLPGSGLLFPLSLRSADGEQRVYGEIAPFDPSARCELHNQTMTITTLSEP